MAEIIKKAKAPAKPKKTATKQAQELKMIDPSHEQIAQLAQQFWAEWSWQDGYAEQDWLRAERELRVTAS
jgi:L-fucose isomerase-like protein